MRLLFLELSRYKYIPSKIISLYYSAKPKPFKPLLNLYQSFTLYNSCTNDVLLLGCLNSAFPRMITCHSGKIKFDKVRQT